MLNLLDQGLAPFAQDSYRPTPGEYQFGDDPTNPVRIVPVDPVSNPWEHQFFQFLVYND